MKKLSKVPKPVGETVGIDLGDKISDTALSIRTATWSKRGVFATRPVPSINTSRANRGASHWEAGAQSAWISGELKLLGHEVIVANPRELKWITSSDTKNDPVDARKLALLARADVRLLAPSNIAVPNSKRNWP